MGLNDGRRVFAAMAAVGVVGLWASREPAGAQGNLPVPQTVRVKMADGTELATDIYRPRPEGRFPTLLLRTPYNKDLGGGIAAGGLAKGYAVVIQDTRGRNASGGKGLPFEGDGWWEGRQDGADTLDWLAAQNWCDGKIGTLGGSALGITQLLASGTGTERVACRQIHVGAPSVFHDLAYTNGVFRKSMVEDWLKATQHHPDSLTFWTSHSRYDSFWKERNLGERWDKVKAPALHVGGWYDIFAEATVTAFQGIQEKGGPGARGRQKLLMGPWTHGIFTDKVGDLTFANAKRPPNRVDDQWRWFDQYLKGQATGIEAEAPVTYYTMGDTTDPTAPGKEWRTSSTWPPPGLSDLGYYLTSERSLNRVAETAPSTLSYVYSPASPAPTLGGPQLTIPSGPRDQRPLERRADVLVFDGPVLRQPLEITGAPRAELYADISTPDTDLVVRLCDVYPDGRSFNITETILRTRFRESLSKEKLLTPGKQYRFDLRLWPTSIVLARGHRLRIHVTSSSSPGWDPNPNTGKPFRADAEQRETTVRLHFGGKNPSRIVLPGKVG